MDIFKKVAIATVFLCAATVANAEEGGIKIGGKVQYFAVQPTGDGAENAEMSFLGFGAGLAFQIPLGAVSLNPGVEFYYSNPLNETIDKGPLGKTEYSVTELGISIPVVVQYDISGAYAGGGIQLDLPLSSKYTEETTGSSNPYLNRKDDGDTQDRSAIDLGIAIVAGYNISDNISVGAKGVIGLTETVKDGKAKYNKYSVGAIYFF